MDESDSSRRADEQTSRRAGRRANGDKWRGPERGASVPGWPLEGRGSGRSCRARSAVTSHPSAKPLTTVAMHDDEAWARLKPSTLYYTTLHYTTLHYITLLHSAQSRPRMHPCRVHVYVCTNPCGGGHGKRRQLETTRHDVGHVSERLQEGIMFRRGVAPMFLRLQ